MEPPPAAYPHHPTITMSGGVTILSSPGSLHHGGPGGLGGGGPGVGLSSLSPSLFLNGTASHAGPHAASSPSSSAGTAGSSSSSGAAGGSAAGSGFGLAPLASVNLAHGVGTTNATSGGVFGSAPGTNMMNLGSLTGPLPMQTHSATGSMAAAAAAAATAAVQLQGATGANGRRSRKKNYSPLQRQQLSFVHALPATLGCSEIALEETGPVTAPKPEIATLFPHTSHVAAVRLVGRMAPPPPAGTQPLNIAVAFCGGQASGGHNVVAGLSDYLRQRCPGSRLYCFVDGPHGLLTGQVLAVDSKRVDAFRNMGGFDIAGTGRLALRKPAALLKCLETCSQLKLDGLVIIGDDDGCTNAALLAEFFAEKHSSCSVVAVPKTIDSDLRAAEWLSLTFGFDTASKLYTFFTSNTMVDMISTQKYYHFIRLMGRGTSHVTLEVALQTHPNVVFICEEVEQQKQTLAQAVEHLVDVIVERAAAGKNFGVIMLPEGLIGCFRDVKVLIDEINTQRPTLPTDAATGRPDLRAFHARLSPASSAMLHSFPPQVQMQMLCDRDASGNVAVAKIETERLFASLVRHALELRAAEGKYAGDFQPQFHFFGYEGRCGLPTPFDGTYCVAMGHTAAALIEQRRTGLLVAVRNLLGPVDTWECGAVNLASLMDMTHQDGTHLPIVAKVPVDLNGYAFKALVAMRRKWAMGEHYVVSTPVQFAAPYAPEDIPITVRIELQGQSAYEAYLQACEGTDVSDDSDREESRPRRAAGGRRQSPDAGGAAAGTDAGGARKRGRVMVEPRFQMIPRTPNSFTKEARLRLSYVPGLPPAFSTPSIPLQLYHLGGQAVSSGPVADREVIRAALPRTYGQPFLEFLPPGHRPTTPAAVQSSAALRIGIVICGRQAAGTNNIIWGVYRCLMDRNRDSKLFGFVGGTTGLVEQRCIEITDSTLEFHRNMGGTLLGRSQDVLHTPAQLAAAQAAVTELALDGLLLVGGIRTQSNAAYLAEHFLARDVKTRVVGVPTGIDGDLKSEFVEATVGFHTACSVYAQIVGNTAGDALSYRKYYYFIRLMGRMPSHIVLECGLRTQPNVVLLGEEVAHKRMSLHDITQYLADVVVQRSEIGKNYGVILVPEGLIKSIPEVDALLEEMNTLFSRGVGAADIAGHLTPWSAALLSYLPAFIQRELFAQREANGSVRLSQLETEKLLAGLVLDELARRQVQGRYHGRFQAVCSFAGYEARSTIPTVFDCDYGYVLGQTAAGLVMSGVTSYLAVVRGLRHPVQKWVPGGAPLTSLLAVTREHGELQPCVLSSPVDLMGRSYQRLAALRPSILLDDLYLAPGPIQFSGLTSTSRSCILLEESHDYVERITKLYELLDSVRDICAVGCSPDLLDTGLAGVSSVAHILSMMDKRAAFSAK